VPVNVSEPIVPFRETVVPPPTVDMVNEAIQDQQVIVKKASGLTLSVCQLLDFQFSYLNIKVKFKILVTKKVVCSFKTFWDLMRYVCVNNSFNIYYLHLQHF
jgi:hypothetical protein